MPTIDPNVPLRRHSRLIPGLAGGLLLLTALAVPRAAWAQG
jgi:hypothetical protein